ncbi:MAG TPA: hypothetical protein VLG67_02090 [Candidatus Saccharimonadales bacterium]|nr:hypothetical protein [Candidatus Saccharimonadales bacterium]
MIKVNELIWDDWNREHLAKHKITQDEVEEVCLSGKYKAEKSYRNRIQLIGKTKKGKLLAIALSPEDRNLKYYGQGIYYVITAYEKEVKTKTTKS